MALERIDNFEKLPDSGPMKFLSLKDLDVDEPMAASQKSLPEFKYETKPLEKPQEDPSFTGFFKNIGHGLENLAKGLGHMAMWLPDKLIRGGSEWVDYIKGNRDSIGNDFTGEAMDVIRQGMNENLKKFVKGTAENYKKYLDNPLQKIYDEPVDAFMDALTILDLGTSAYGSYANHAAKAARASGKMAEAAEWALKAENAAKGGIKQFLKPIAESPVLNQVRKIDVVDKALQAAHLTPESRKVADLWNEIINKYQSVSKDADIKDILVTLQSVPEKDAAENIMKVALGMMPDNAITHPSSRKALEYLRKIVSEQTLEKIERTSGLPTASRLTAHRAEAAIWLPLRYHLTRLELGKLRNAGQIEEIHMRQFNKLLRMTERTNESRGLVRKLYANGGLQKLFTSEEIKALIKDKKPNNFLLNKLAPMESQYKSYKTTVRDAGAKGAVSGMADQVRKTRTFRQQAWQQMNQAEDNLKGLSDAAAERWWKLRDQIDTFGPEGGRITHPDGTVEYIRPPQNVGQPHRDWVNFWKKHGITPDSERGVGPALGDFMLGDHHKWFDLMSDASLPLRDEYYQARRALHGAGEPLAHEEGIFDLASHTMDVRQVQNEVRQIYKSIEDQTKKFNSADRRFKNFMRQETALIDRLREIFKGRTKTEVGNIMTKEGVLDLAKRTDLQPFYLPLIHSKHLDVANAFIPREFRNAKASWMKARTGAEGNVMDVRLIAPIMRSQFRQFQAINEFITRLQTQPFVKDVTAEIKLGKYIPKKNTVLASFDHGFLPFYKDVFQTQSRLGRAIKDIVNADGEITSDALKQAVMRTLTPELEEMVKNSLAKRGAHIRVHEIPKDVGQILTRQVTQISPLAKFVFDSPMDLLRVSALYMNPMWYMGNLFGNAILNLMGGVSPFSYFRGGKRSFRTIVPDELRDVISSALNTSFTQAERAKRGLTSLPPFRQMGAVQEKIEDFFRSAHFMDQITKEGVKRKLISPMQGMFAADEVIAQKLRPIFDEAARRGKLIPEVVLGLQDASAVRQAIGHTNQWLFDYSNLHPVERNIIRRIVPFWTFMKNIHLLMLRLPIDRPLLSRALGMVGEIHRDKLAHAAIDAMDDDGLPDWLEGHVPFGHDSEGHFLFASVKGLNPFNGFGSMADPKKLISATNPIIKATLEYFGGRDMWSKKDLKSNEPIFDYTGRQYRVRIEGGKVQLVRDVPGESWVGQFMNQYPQIKLLRQIYKNFVHEPQDVTGKPPTGPYRDEVGNWEYPVKLIDQAVRMVGLNIKRVNPADLKYRETKLRVDFIRKMADQLRTAPPDYRNFIMESIRRAAQGDFDAEGY